MTPHHLSALIVSACAAGLALSACAEAETETAVQEPVEDASAAAQPAPKVQPGADIIAAAPDSDWRTVPTENLLHMVTSKGEVWIELAPEFTPNHIARIREMADVDWMDWKVFHRVIDGFMAQTGDVANGNMEKDFNLRRAGTGGSEHPDLPAEFSKLPHDRGTLGAARSQNPNSANSQFFINFADNHFLNGQYTVYGRVIEGMEHVDAITRGEPPADPDRMISMKVAADA